MSLPEPELEVVVRGLRRMYPLGSSEVHALQGIELDVGRGQFVAVVGVSGSGKSTLLHLVGGLDTPTSGQVFVGGQEVGRLSPRARALFRRQVVGFVFQSFYLIPNLTAAGNLHLALMFQGVYGTRRRQLATEALERVGLAGRANHRPGQLSAGEQQRVAVARAIVHRPRLLLADEPTGNLDHATAGSLLKLIRGLQHETAMTVLMVTHDEELVSGFCDRMIRLRDGSIIDSWQRF